MSEINQNNVYSSRDEVVVKQVSMVLPKITRWQQPTLDTSHYLRLLAFIRMP